MRTPIVRISAPSPITPVAQPVNAYVRPADPAPSPLWDVAKGLAAFDQGLQSFVSKRQEHFDEADKIRAEAAFNENNQLGWAEAVRLGKVPANASPVFMKSYKTAQGNLAGIQLREKFNAEYLKWDGKNSNDPNAFRQFMSDFVTKNVTAGDDVDVLRGLNPHIEKLYQDGYSVFGSDSAKSVYEGSVNTKAAIAGRTIDAGDQQGLEEGKGTDYEKLWSDLTQQRKEALASGIRKEDYDAQLAATIATKAVELRDPKLLDLLDKTVEGDTVALKDYPKFRAIKLDAIEKLETIARQQIIDRDKAQTKEDKAKQDAIEGGVARALATNPGEEIPEDVMKEWEKYDPKARERVASMRKTFAEEDTMEDQRELLLIQRDIATGTVRRSELMKMVAEGKIKDPKTLSNLLDRVERFDKSRQEGTGILTDQTTKRFTKAIAERMVGPGEKAIADIFGNPMMNDEALQAINDFESALMQWDEKNPDATFAQRQEEINRTGELILKRIDPNLMSTDENKYKSDTEQAFDQAKQSEAVATEQADKFGNNQSTARMDALSKELSADSQKLDADPAAVDQQVEQQRDERVDQLYQGEKPPAIEELPEANRKYIEEQAAKAGMTPEELNMEIWKRAREIIHNATGQDDVDGGAKTDTLSEILPTTVEQLQANLENGSSLEDTIGATIDSVVKNGGMTSVPKSSNPEVGALLDLFGRSEGTDRRRGYNETLGYGKFTGGDVELTKMTLGEIKALQRKMLAHKDNEWNSSALGRYQIVGKTLRKLQSQMGLGDDVRFDEKTQDAMALQLLKGRGYDKWKAGKMSDEDFMDNLAQEWASVPTRNGTGYYGNQKRTPIKPADVLTAFRAVRTGASPFDSILTGKDTSDKARPAAYAKIPEAELDQFMQWNSDPEGNSEANLKTVKEPLQKVFKTAQKALAANGIKIVVASGHRDEALQKKAMEWGWTKTMDSNHRHGDALDVWVIGDDGAIDWDEQKQALVAEAMKATAEELGVKVGWGGDWKGFKDKPHFELK